MANKVTFPQDITFCLQKNCDYTGCMRHYSHYDCTVKPFCSISDFKNTMFCPLYNPKTKSEVF